MIFFGPLPSIHAPKRRSACGALLLSILAIAGGGPAHALQSAEGGALFPLVVAGDESAQRFREALGLIEEGTAESSEPLSPDAIRGIRQLQVLHEEIWGRNHMLVDPSLARQDAEVAVSLTEKIIDALLALPDPVRAFYLSEYGLSARSLLERALAAQDVESLVRTAQLYPLIDTAPRALLAAGDLCFERAQISRADGIWSSLPRLAPSGVHEEELALRRALVASRRGTARERAAARADLERFGREFPELGAAQGADPRIDATGELPDLPFERGRLDWRTVPYARENYFDDDDILPFAAVPTRGPGWIAVATSRRVLRYSVDSGKQIGEVALLPSLHYSEKTSLPRFYTVSEGDLLVTSYVADRTDSKNYLGYAIEVEIPQRGLKGIRIGSEDVIWDTIRNNPDELLRELSFNGSIAIDGSRVYALAWRKKGYIDVFLVCLDLHSGKRLWSAPIVGNQVELTMFGEAAYEPVVGQVAVDGDAVYCSTNLGAIAKVRSSDGHVLWATAYDPLRKRQRRGRRRTPMQQMTVWERNPLVLHEGRLFATPLDSSRLLALDPADGRVIQDVRGSGWMVGVWDEYLVLLEHRSLRLLPFRDLDRGGRAFALPGTVRSRPGLVKDGLVYTTEGEGLFHQSFTDPRRTSPQRLSGYGPIFGGGRGRGASPIRDGDIHVLPDRILTVSSQWIQCYVSAPPAEEGGDR